MAATKILLPARNSITMAIKPNRSFSSTSTSNAATHRTARRCRTPRTASTKQNAAGTSGQMRVA